MFLYNDIKNNRVSLSFLRRNCSFNLFSSFFVESAIVAVVLLINVRHPFVKSLYPQKIGNTTLVNSFRKYMNSKVLILNSIGVKMNS